MNVAKLNVVMPSLIVSLVAKLIQNVNQIVTEISPHASKCNKKPAHWSIKVIYLQYNVSIFGRLLYI